MVLFSLIYKFPLCSFRSQRKLAIQRFTAGKNSISLMQTANRAKVSRFTGLVLFNFNPSLQSTKCCSSSTSSSGSSIKTKRRPRAVRLFVKGLATSVSEGILRKAFSEFGEVTAVRIMISEKTGQSLGFAFVWLCSEDFGQRAIEEMNGKFLEGRFIKVSKAKPGPPKPSEKPWNF